MHRMSYCAAGIGLLFLSFAMATGLGRAVVQRQLPDPLFSSGASWFLFGGLLLMGKLGHVSGRRFAVGTLLMTLVDIGALFLTEFLHQSHLQG